MLTIPCKEGEAPIDPLWVKEWQELYYNVDQEILKARSWALDNPERRKTRKGIRRFLGNWIRKACPLRPIIRTTKIVHEEAKYEPLEVRQARLAELRRAVR